MERKKILIVDNIEYDIQDLRKSLIATGFEVRIAQTASDILPYIENFNPDLVLIEIRLPDLKLPELIPQIRKLDASKAIPIVAAGSPKTIEERIAILDLEVDDFIYKPFELEESLVRFEMLMKEAATVSEKPPVTSRGFSGSLAEMTLVDLLQTLEVGKKNSIITLQHTGVEGKVFVTDGEVADAALGGLDAKQALMRMFTWTDGHFRVEMVKHDRDKRILTQTRELISEGITRLYRWEQLVKLLPPLQSIVLASPKTAGANLTSDEQQVLKLLKGRKRFIDVVEESTFDDLKALRLLKGLFEKGVVIEALHQESLINDDYLKKNRTHPNNGTATPEALVSVLSNIFREPSTSGTEFNDRRRKDRRQQDRRRSDRRRGFSRPGHKIFLNKSELVMLREKLLAGIKKLQQEKGKA